MNNYKYAGFGVRFVAALIDVFLLVLGSTAISYMLEAVMGDNGTLLSGFLGWLVSIWYYVWYQEQNGQTVGKKAMNIKVVTYDGKTPSKFTFFLRDIVGKLISGLILLIGYLMVLWDPKKQALHDKIASTYVVYVGEVSPKQPQPEQKSQAQEAPLMQS